jgi:hypothetical protein
MSCRFRTLESWPCANASVRGTSTAHYLASRWSCRIWRSQCKLFPVYGPTGPCGIQGAINFACVRWHRFRIQIYKVTGASNTLHAPPQYSWSILPLCLYPPKTSCLQFWRKCMSHYICPSAVKLLRPSGWLLCSASWEQLISLGDRRCLLDALHTCFDSYAWCLHPT